MTIEYLYPPMGREELLEKCFHYTDGKSRKEIVKKNFRYIGKHIKETEKYQLAQYLQEVMDYLEEQMFPFCKIILEEMYWFANVLPSPYRNVFIEDLKILKKRLHEPSRTSLALYYSFEYDEFGSFFVCCDEIQYVDSDNDDMPYCQECGQVYEDRAYYSPKKEVL